MDRMRRRARRAWLAPLATLLFMTGIADPLLETVRPDAGPVLESGHSPDDCGRGHDHSLCTVIDGGFALPPSIAVDTGAATPDRHLVRPTADRTGTDSLPGGHPPRGPPTD